MAMAMGVRVGVQPLRTVTGSVSGRDGEGVASLHFAGSSFCGRLQAAASGQPVTGFGRDLSFVPVRCGAAAAVDGTAVAGMELHLVEFCVLWFEVVCEFEIVEIEVQGLGFRV